MNAKSLQLQEIAVLRIAHLFSAVGALLFAQSCQGACRNEIINQVESPSGVYAATIFQRNCGATSGNNFQVSIFRRDAALDGSGNTFVVDYPNNFYQPGHPLPVVKLRWNSESTVTIEYSSGARIFTQAVMIQGINVNYVTK
jgi:hypothetical protein